MNKDLLFIIRFRTVVYGAYTKTYTQAEAEALAAELNSEADGVEYWMEPVGKNQHTTDQLTAFANYAINNKIEAGDLDIYAASQFDCELYSEFFPGGCSCRACVDAGRYVEPISSLTQDTV